MNEFRLLEILDDLEYDLTDEFSFGKELYINGAVKKFTVTEMDNKYLLIPDRKVKKYDHISAEVVKRGEGYKVSVDFTEFDYENLNCSCGDVLWYECPCEHCIAVFFAYYAYLKNNKGQTVKSETAVTNQKASTTPFLSEMLKQKVEMYTIPAIEDHSQEKVKIEPYISVSREGIINVDFKLGTNRMYVMKNIFEFVEQVENKALFKYGKSLEFVHSMDAFDSDAKKIIKFLIPWTKENRNRYMSYSYSYYYYAKPTVKIIEIDSRYIEPFFGLLVGKPFNMAVAGSKNTTWTIAEEPIKKKLGIVYEDTAEKKGITLSFKNNSFIEDGGIRLNFCDDKLYIERMSDTGEINEFIEGIANSKSSSAFLEEKDIPLFCTEILPILEKYCTITKKHFEVAKYQIEKPVFRAYFDSPQDDMIVCRPETVYGEKVYNIYSEEDINHRNIPEENRFKQLVKQYGNSFDPTTKSIAALGDDNVIYDMLVNGIPKIQEMAEVYISDALKKMQVREVPKVTVGVSVDGNMLELNMSAGEMPLNELAEILSKYNKKKKYYRLKNGSFVKVDDDNINSAMETIGELKKGLGLNDKEFAKGEIKLPKFRALFIDSQMENVKSIDTVRDNHFRNLISNMKTVEDNDFKVPDKFESVLREYQKKGFMWIKTLKNNGFGGILADDMGLGKTIQVISFLFSEFFEDNDKKKSYKKKSDIRKNDLKKALIICPASLVYNWFEEFGRFAPEINTVMVVGNAAPRKDIIDNIALAQESEKLTSGIVYITSYDLLKRDIESYKDIYFDYQIIDEAQYIKNQGTQVAKAVKLIDSGFRLALTGTPVENRLSELWSSFDFLMPGFLYGYEKFKSEMEVPIVQNNDAKATNRLQRMIHPFILRRLKKDVLKDLPDKMEENIYSVLGEKQQQLYDAHVQRIKILLDNKSEKDFGKAKIQILSELTQLRELCCEPKLIYEDYDGENAKLDTCINMINTAVEGGHKILVFSQFTRMLDIIAFQLDKEKISYYKLVGDTPAKKRVEMVESFNNDDTNVFLISLRAGGTGLNLTSADIVIHFDPWWNVAAQNQATDRAHRIGQKNVVTVYKLVAKGSIEENIIRLQEKKKDLADKILSGNDVGNGNFTKEELMEILK